MDTITDDMDKQAQASINSILHGLGLAGTIPSNLMKSYLALAAALGVAGGAGAGIISSKIKEKDPETLSMERQKRFYDKKVEEMENDNWLNDLMATKSSLDNGKLSAAERKALEAKYVGLINRGSMK